uniref:Uncharacterized protein n=1 Tax=Mus musculus TaxID=10090 RepID=Q3UY18_MOUSE|nr:unnamed protein product [Mus musculus]
MTLKTEECCPLRGSTQQLTQTDNRDLQPNSGWSLGILMEGLKAQKRIRTPQEDQYCSMGRKNPEATLPPPLQTHRSSRQFCSELQLCKDVYFNNAQGEVRHTWSYREGTCEKSYCAAHQHSRKIRDVVENKPDNCGQLEKTVTIANFYQSGVC